MDCVALVMRVVNRVHDDPRLFEARADHRDAELLARATATSVAADEEPGLDRMLAPGRGAQRRLDAILRCGDTGQLGVEADLDAGEALGPGEQHRLEFGLVDRILDGEAQARSHRAADVGQRPPVCSVVVGTGPRKDHIGGGVQQAGGLERAHRLVVDADSTRLGYRAGARLDHEHPGAEPAEQVGERQPRRTGADDEHVNRLDDAATCRAFHLLRHLTLGRYSRPHPRADGLAD